MGDKVGESAVHSHHHRTHKQGLVWVSMSIEALALNCLAGGILVAHLATLRLLWDCKNHLTGEAANFGHFQAVVSDSVDELVRIGSDVADQIDTVANGAVAGAVATSMPEVDIKSTIIDLITSNILGSFDGNKTQSERAIYSEEGETTQSESISESTTDTD